MANIFRSKEVFKNARKRNGDKVVVPVYGVYVSGEYKPPYYNDMGVRITNISSNPATVANFTQNEITMRDDHVLNLIELTMDTTCPTIINFTQDEKTMKDDHVLNLIDLTMDASLSYIISYTQDEVTMHDDHVLNLLELTMDYGLSSYTQYTKTHKNMTPDPSLRMTSIRTSKATVSNYTP